jgi:Uma2 family endonuclease
MVQRLLEEYRFDEADPRAPTQEQWDRMSPEERARVVAKLPSDFAIVPFDVQPPEGDHHWKASAVARLTLDAFFRRIGRKIYVSSSIAVFYPGERVFAPDLLAVLDVEPHDRKSFTVSREGKGLDFALEVHVSSDRAKDDERNVERYARLGIPEYFIFDRGQLTLRGYQLPPAEAGGARAYRPILPQGGRYASQVLGLDLALEGSRLRFLLGMAPVPEAEELVGKLSSMLDDVIAGKTEAEQRAAEATQRAAEVEQRAEELARKLGEAEAEIERLKRGG